MKLSREEYANLILKHPNLAPKENHIKNPRKVAKLESSPCYAFLEKNENEKRYSGPILISVTSTRKRLCDSDNLAAKWHVDCLRYCRIIPGDEPEKATIKISQKKCSKNQEEFIEIEIEYP